MTESSANASSVSDTQLRNAPRDLLNLGEAQLHLWLCRRDAATNSDTFKRNVLSRYVPVAPADWQFSVSEHGKPHVLGQTSALEFNISHSRDWLACAVASSAPLGVDIEYCDPRREAMKLARRFFCTAEVAALEAVDAAMQQDRFYDLWTLKEAAVKARAEALAPGLQLRGFELDYSTGPTTEPGRIEPASQVTPEQAHYFLLDPVPGYRVAICSLARSLQLPALCVYQICGRNAVMECSVALRARSCAD